jgi:chromosome segregation protein
MKPSYLQGEVTRLTNAITALGRGQHGRARRAGAASERKNFLDAQSPI